MNDEVRNQDIQFEIDNNEMFDMDDPRGLLTALVSEVVWLRRELDTFNSIFATETRARFLANKGPHVMSVLQRALSRDIALQIARLLDPLDSPAKGGRRKNRTLWALDSLLDKKSEIYPNEIYSKWHHALVELDTSVGDNFRIGRNRVIAHSDELVASGIEQAPPPPDDVLNTTVDQLQQILTLAWIIVNGTGSPWSSFQADIEQEVALVFTSAAPRGPQR